LVLQEAGRKDRRGHWRASLLVGIYVPRYPDGLEGDAIPLGARILLVADAYDSMTSKRTYRPAMSLHQALSELCAGAGTQFDPDRVAALEQHLASAHAA